MLWIGLSGGMGCGKSSALKLFKELGSGTESADEIVSILYTKKEVLEKIGQALDLRLTDDLAKFKKEVSSLVFKDRSKLSLIEDILHPMVREKAEEARAKLKSEGKKVSFYEIPLLFEKNLEKHFDQTLCIGADKKTQLERIRLRNPDWSEQEIKSRIEKQLSLKEKQKRADFYIDNSGSLEELKKACKDYLVKLRANS